MIATAPRVLLVDDDVELSAMLSEYLEGEGFQVEAVPSGIDGVERALSADHDAVILDVMMPRLNGIEALRQIRASSQIPIVMLTARGDQIDRIVGLELGADDYVAKPCHPRELLARLRSVMRRHAPAVEREPVLLRNGPLSVQLAARRVSWNGSALELTVTEFKILVLLMRADDTVVTKDRLSLEALGRARRSYDRSVDVHVSNLRLKLEAVSNGRVLIETVRGVGHRLQVAR